LIFVEFAEMPKVTGMDETFVSLGIGLVGAKAVMSAAENVADMIL